MMLDKFDIYSALNIPVQEAENSRKRELAVR